MLSRVNVVRMVGMGRVEEETSSVRWNGCASLCMRMLHVCVCVCMCVCVQVYGDSV